jgi:uncharacterized SAM-binding protein YcdF (DUF218 family)
MNIQIHHILSHSGKFIRYFLLGLGAMALTMAALAFTRLPFDAHRWLGETGSHFRFEPDVIVMLGGSGMPSESNLIRLYYTAHWANIYDQSRIIIAHPHDSGVAGTMTDYLVSNGIDSSRISLMLDGTNTREQALMLIAGDSSLTSQKMALVTSPENMYRTIRVFRKLGYNQIGGISAFENAMFVDLSYKHKSIGGKAFTPDVSGNLDLRYNFWNYLKLEITCLREWVAIGYYWVNGWI